MIISGYVAGYRFQKVASALARFEVLGLDTDRELIRSIARRLSDNDPDTARMILPAITETNDCVIATDNERTLPV